MERTPYFLAALIALLFLSGCASKGADSGATEPEPNPATQSGSFTPSSSAKKYYDRVNTEGKRNEVLNLLRAGLVSFELQDFQAAEVAFSRAIATIESVYTQNQNDKKAQKRRKKLKFTAKENFVGDDYERVMAYYYRGLVYLAQARYRDAIGSFKGGLQQDAMAGKDNVTPDFAAMEWLSGWAARCLEHSGNFSYQSSRAFTSAAAMNSLLETPPESDNFLLLAETGSSPVKVASDEKRDAVSYEQGDSIALEYFIANNSAYKVVEAADIFYQARSRGGTLLTHIPGKKPADVRYWDNLPDRLFLGTATMPDVSYISTIEVSDDRANSIKVYRTDGICGFAWLRSHSAASIPAIHVNARN